MNLFDFAKEIKRTLYIEVRPNGDCITSFGVDCDLLRHGSRIRSVHGRGKSISESIKSLIDALTNQGGVLEFPRSFESDAKCKIPEGLTDANI